MSALARRCAEVLRGNDRGQHTVPSPALYPHQWAWDSAFAAIGWGHIDRGRALAELRSLLGAAWDDGRVPHIRFDADVADYWPGPDFWGTTHTSAITQPPLWATAARRLLQLGVDATELAPLLTLIERSHLFFHARRDPEGLGLVAVVHPWESGMDNSPAWDAPLADVDPAGAPGFVRRDTRHVASAAERPTDDHYRRYAVLVQAIARDGFGPGRFAVYDPAMSALLARAELDLAALCAACSVETEAAARAERLQRALVDRLWDDQLGRFRYRDARRGRDLMPDVIGAYMPLLLDLDQRLGDRLRAELAQRFDAAWPLPSTAPAAPAYDPRCYWRGPTWVNVNWLLAPVLGEPLRARTLEMVERAGFWEYYHPDTGQGLGGPSFTWSAALCLDLLAAA